MTIGWQEIIVFLVIAIPLGLITALIARSRGRRFLVWWLFGTALFPIALPLAIALPPVQSTLDRRRPQAASRCEHCDGPIGPGHAFCSMCGAPVATGTDVGVQVEEDPEPVSELDEGYEEGVVLLTHEELPAAGDPVSDLIGRGAADLADEGQDTAAGPEPGESSPVLERHRARWPLVVAGVVVLLLALAAGGWLWVRHGQTVYDQANAAYLQGDCQTALSQYARLHLYPRLAGQFVELLRQEEVECVDYEVAAGLAAAGAYADAIPGWEQLRSDEPDSPLSLFALQAIVDAYSAWASAQRQAGDFEDSLDTSDQLAADYPDFQARADGDVEVTYLAWGNALCEAGDYEQAGWVYDAMAERGEPFIQPARLAWAQVMLDWAAVLADQGAYAAAEANYRALLHREHGWLAPLTNAGWEAARSESYGRLWTAADAPDQPLRAGPGEQYATLDVTLQPGKIALEVAGTSAEPGWYAVFSTGDGSSTLGWLSVKDAGRQETGNLGTPLSGVLADALADGSPAAAQAVEGLRELYPMWAAAVGPAEAVPLYASLAELVTEDAARQAAWQQALQSDLEAARAEAERGDYTRSINRTLEIEDYDREGTITVEARALRASNRLALGDLASAAGEWERALGEYEAVLALELDTYSVGQATVTKQGAVMRESPYASAPVAFEAPRGWEWPVLGRSSGDGPGWILLLVEQAPKATEWIALEYVRLSTPFEKLPDRDGAAAVELYSHEAHMGWLRATLGWASELEASHDWEEALSLYQQAFDWSVPESRESERGLGGVIRTRLAWASELEARRDWEEALSQYQAATDAARLGTPEFASGLDGVIRSHLAWAGDLSANKQWLEAVDQYKAVLKSAAEGSQPGADALAGLEALAAQAESMVAAEPCDAVSLLDALAETASAPRAAETLPEALLQCGHALVEKDRLAQAEAKYLRVPTEFPESKQAMAAQRGVQRIAWINSIDELGLYDAADAVCEKAGAKAQAKVSTLDKPWVAYLVGGDYGWSDLLPDSLAGEERQTTVVVWVGEEQESQIEVCPRVMVTGPDAGKDLDLYRIRYYRRVRLVDPVTGLTVAAGTIYGSVPQACPDSGSINYTIFTGRFYYYGDHPDGQDLVAWINKKLK